MWLAFYPHNFCNIGYVCLSYEIKTYCYYYYYYYYYYYSRGYPPGPAMKRFSPSLSSDFTFSSPKGKGKPFVT